MNKRSIGNLGEELAADYLISKGYSILDRNYYTDHGEIDIVARDGEYYVFCEVKYRKDTECGNPLEAITKSKQRRIYNAARIYLYLNHLPETVPVRFDCIGISGSRINHIKDAFLH